MVCNSNGCNNNLLFLCTLISKSLLADMWLKDFFSYQFSCRKPHINAVFNDKTLDNTTLKIIKM